MCWGEGRKSAQQFHVTGNIAFAIQHLVFIWWLCSVHFCWRFTSDPIELSMQARRRKQTRLVSIFFAAFFFSYLLLSALLSKIKRGQNKTLYIMKHRQREKWQHTKLFSVFF